MSKIFSCSPFGWVDLRCSVGIMVVMITSTDIVAEKINTKDEVRLLRSFIIGLLGKDEEGDYRSEFVTKALKAAREESRGVITDPETFFKNL